MDDSTTHMVVVIPVTAGTAGQAAELLSSLPTDLAAPLVVPVHGGPNALTALQSSLAGASERSIVTATAGSFPLQAGAMYLIAATSAVEILDSHVTVRETPSEAGEQPDGAVESLARALGEHVVGVFVDASAPGTASDIYEINAHEGTVIVVGLMGPGELPATIPPSKVDVVTSPEELDSVISTLLQSGTLPAEHSMSAVLRALLHDLRDRFGINFAAYKQPTIVRRIRRRMADTGQTTLPAYVNYLQSHPDESQRLVSSFLIKVTSFFRDPELYDYLQRHIIPDLVEYARDHDNELRIWSARCATGEEAYSLAIMVSEVLGDDFDSIRGRIFATDLDAAAIEFARRGVYPPAALDDLPEEIVHRYFVQLDGAYQVAKRIRALCIFGQHDLAERAPFPRIDLLVSRNVLIYFTSELQRRVLQLFAFSLRDNGYLVLGKSETTTPLPEHFVADNSLVKVYRRRGERMLIPPARIRQTTPGVSTRHQPTRPAHSVESLRAAQDGVRPSRLRERADGALMQLPVGVIYVNGQYDIQFINTAARRLLRIHGNALGEDLVHLAQDLPPRELRRAIDAALSTGQASPLDDVPVTEPATGELQYLHIAVSAHDENGGEQLARILVEDVTDKVVRLRALEEALEAERRESASLHDQVERLSETNQSLLAANQELTLINMELGSANEEYLVGNEELQAAAEEVETLNEELQATNEELETLNEELQATVEELNATNEDLQSRSVELEDLAVTLQAQRAEVETERARLESVLSGMPDALLLVDRAGLRRFANPAFAAMFPAPFQPLDSNGQPLEDEATPWAAAARGEICDLEFAVREPDGTHRRFEARGRPLGEVDGGVVVIRDITERPGMAQAEASG